MNSLKRPQRDKARQFMVFTGSSERNALEFLKMHDWNLEGAVDGFFSSGGRPSGPHVDADKIGAWFDSYKDSETDAIQVDGMEKFCTSIGVEPSDVLMLIIAWQMRAKTMCVFTKEEWTRGMTAMGCDSIETLQGSFASLREQLDDPQQFKDFYGFCFNFAKEPGFGVRSLPMEVARQMWQLTLGGRFKYLPQWFEFLNTTKERAVTKDVWDMLHTFGTTINDDMSNFDDDGAWPVLLDDFVEWYRTQKA